MRGGLDKLRIDQRVDLLGHVGGCERHVYHPVGDEDGVGNRPAHDAQRDNQLIGEEGERRSEEHTSELQSLMRISYAVFCLKKKHTYNHTCAPLILTYPVYINI